jgi:hypothetical protein
MWLIPRDDPDASDHNPPIRDAIMDHQDAAPPVFRSLKRRRLSRQPAADDDQPADAPDDAPDPTMPSVVPLSKRRLFRARNMGLDVSTPPAPAALQPPRDAMPDPAQTPRPASLAPIKFAPPTGLVKDDLEKHM